MRFLTGESGGFLLDGLANFFVDARDSDEDGGADFLHRLRELVEVGAVGNLRAVAVHDVVERAGGDVREGKEGDAGVGFVEGVTRAAARFWLEAMLPCVSITPLGSPVVPEV